MKDLSITRAKRTRFKISIWAMILASSALSFFSYLGYEQYTETRDISLGIGTVIGGVLTLIGAIVQIYGGQETRRPSENSTVVQIGDGNTNKRYLPNDFEDATDPPAMPKNI